MALTKTPIELSSTPSIVDGGNDTAITIDSSENVLVGTTTTNIATEGTVIYGSGNEGVMQLSSTAMPAFYVNRSNDGELVQFRQGGGNIVGQINSRSNDMVIGTGDTGLQFYDTGNAIFPLSASGNTNRDAAIDLGETSNRFKDLYLSGGAYLGGTAAANKLDDYEEGTHITTVSFSSGGSATLQEKTLTYTKIGNAVIVTGYVSFSAISSPNGILRFTLPFPVAFGSQYRSSANCKFNALSTGYGLNETPWAIVEDNASTVAVYGGQSTSVNFVMGVACTSATDFRVSVSYITSA